MKKGKIIAILLPLLAWACSSQKIDRTPLDDNSLPSDVELVVTVKQAADGTVYFQRGDSERLYPGTDYPFAGQQRVMCSLTVYAEQVPEYGKKVHINWQEELDRGPDYSPTYKYAAAPGEHKAGIDIRRDWITSVEDGYLTLHYDAWWGESPSHHGLYLQAGSEPYNLTLVHLDGGDGRDEYTDAIVYFDINTLPPTNGEYQTLTLNWTATDGSSQQAQFGFKTRE